MSRLPEWLLKKAPKIPQLRQLRTLLQDSSLNTVCEEAKCPNLGECFAQKTCTFMILGDICTRSCAFCGVKKGSPKAIDPNEPAAIAAAVKKLGLAYTVITSVTRDDLPDGGADHFAAVIKAVSHISQVEVLIPDFLEHLEVVLAAKPFTLNHNVETVPRLYPTIRPQASYTRSLALISRAKNSGQVVYTKSGFMVGLGESRAEIETVLQDLKAAGCDLVTIGQYLPPSRAHLPPVRFVPPEEFEQYRDFGLALGLQDVFAGPFVRSSYHAARILK
ncbi:lipoyl synthase [candidate division WOR-1 bacterium RIFOXYB2_FULL_48_7]|uniref:Lipoyl synthase n=1 Tax=candidate division WOR-1 bacterium RIFOXYB2_FULL_48_7 TaxID=1802583 RepID=A0A1F4TF96_UNCSA|nr:MAG: lipoyl synthase [candidate division WOR-1 bacterium RIFOXYB2_FULL_48_7]